MEFGYRKLNEKCSCCRLAARNKDTDEGEKNAKGNKKTSSE